MQLSLLSRKYPRQKTVTITSQSLQSWHEPCRGLWYKHSCKLHCSPPPPALMFSDQYAFRPTAALVFLLQTITNLLAEQPYVVVIALDFSKAFDTVRHSTLLQKLASLDIPDTVYNWLVDYFLGHSHCTEFRGHISTFLNISASIVQGSPGDLTPLTLGNVFCKYADDTYLVIPASNVDSKLVK